MVTKALDYILPNGDRAIINVAQGLLCIPNVARNKGSEEKGHTMDLNRKFFGKDKAAVVAAVTALAVALKVNGKGWVSVVEAGGAKSGEYYRLCVTNECPPAEAAKLYENAGTLMLALADGAYAIETGRNMRPALPGKPGAESKQVII